MKRKLTCADPVSACASLDRPIIAYSFRLQGSLVEFDSDLNYYFVGFLITNVQRVRRGK